MTAAEAAVIMMGGAGGKVKPLTVTENGTYAAPEGYVGFEPVEVNVPGQMLSLASIVNSPTMGSLNFGDYKAVFKAVLLAGTAKNPGFVIPTGSSSAKISSIIYGDYRLGIVIEKNNVVKYANIRWNGGDLVNEQENFQYKSGSAELGYHSLTRWIPTSISIDESRIWSNGIGSAQVYYKWNSTRELTEYDPVDGSIKSVTTSQSQATRYNTIDNIIYGNSWIDFMYSDLSQDDLNEEILAASQAFYDVYKYVETT